MRKLVLIIIGLFLISSLRAADMDSLFSNANTAYSSGFYLEAIDSYLTIVDQGYVSADLYFNIGNACFKLEDYPSAILYYEKAIKLDPNDEDVLFNLGLANTLIIDKIEPIPELFLKTWWRSITNLFNTDVWAMISVGTFALFFILLAFYLLSRITRVRKIAFFSGLVVLFIALFSFSISFQKFNEFNHEKAAIVFTPTITVKSSPNPNSVDLFVIHEGSKVSIKDQVGEWFEIRIANGSVGWLPSSAVRQI